MDYPVIFKCCECTVEHSTLELLESHIWNRHLQTFPFHCAFCNYPALSEKALTMHFYDAHPKKPVEFKRKILVESQLRDFIAQSIVVPVYDVDDTAEAEVIYEDEASQDHLGDMETLQPADQEQFHMQSGPSGHDRRRGSAHDKDLVDNVEWDQPPNLKRIDDDSDVVFLDGISDQQKLDHLQNGDVIAEEEVEEEMVLQEGGGEMEGMMGSMEEDEGHQGHHQQQYLYDEDGNVFEGEEGEGEVEYIDEQGNIFFTSTYHHKGLGGRSDHHVRMMKNRHMEMIVRKVASDHTDLRKKPPTIAQCDICGKVLKYPSRIEAHRRMHSQEKVFHCMHCDKAFTQRSSLNIHLRKHTGEKPYACTWECGKTFSSSSALRMHEKSHSGERNFPCSICGQLFSKRSHVIRHEKTRHSNVVHDEDEMEEEEVLTGEEKAVVDEVVESVRTEKFNKMFNKQHMKMMKGAEEMPSLHD